MNLNFDPARVSPAQRRAIFRAAMAHVQAEMAGVREESAGKRYPDVATIDRTIDSLRQVRLIAADAAELEQREIAAAEQSAEVPL